MEILEESWVLLKGYPYPKGRLSTTTSSKGSTLLSETYPHSPRSYYLRILRPLLTKQSAPH